MRKMAGLVLVCVCGCFVISLAAQPAATPATPAQPAIKSPAPQPPQDERTAKMREFWDIRKKMGDIEKQAASQDEEIKKLDAQFETLKKQAMELNKQKGDRLNVLLADNKDYQELKKKMDALRTSLQPPSPAAAPKATAPKDDKTAAQTAVQAPAAPKTDKPKKKK